MTLKDNRKKRKVLSPAKDIVAPWLEKLGLKPQVLAVFDAWDRLLGPEAAKARAVGMKGPVLHVETDSSARLHDLTLRKAGLLKRLQGFFGEQGPRAPFETGKTVSDIIFRLAEDEK
jgi:predicted nucleic acid-binding Zn ribbon protein